MINKIVFVWVGWAGVSAVVRLFLWCGFKNCVGIDSTNWELTKQLQSEWLEIVIGHGNYEVNAHDFVIYSSAAINSPEVQSAKALFESGASIRPPFSYFEFLWELSKCFSTIAVAGTHGKSTTTALAAHALAKHHPNFWLGIVGAGLADWWSANMKISETHAEDIRALVRYIIDPKAAGCEHLMKKYLFIVEACEYNYQFLSLDVDHAVFTNIELDHADVYETFENYLDTFVQFSKKVRRSVTTLVDTQWIPSIQASLDLKIQEHEIQQFDFKHLLGSHNHANATLALKICELVNDWNIYSSDEIKHTIQWFTWLRRRWELLGNNTHGVPIITDYAHHPTELSSTLQAVHEKYADQEVTLLFQPHQARRVVEFWDEFIETLAPENEVIIYSIYTAREKIQDISWYTIQSSYLNDEVGNLQSFDDLGELFVKQFDGTYITAFDQIKEMINNKTEWVILICTAGNLDWEVRKLNEV